jgi:hypothetical protein
MQNFKLAAVSLAASALLPALGLATQRTPPPAVSSVTLAAFPPDHKPIRAVHLTCWNAGSKKYREKLNERLKNSSVNALVIDIKEYHGEVYLPGVELVHQAGAYVNAIPDLADWVAELKKRGIYTIARVVVFKDNIYARKNRAAAVKNRLGEIWYDRNRVTWLDPYNKEAHRYNLVIAHAAARMGFDEIQFDYIRFPTDGNLKMIKYPGPHTRESASDALVTFLSEARRLLHPLGVKISIDVFGLVTSDNSGMGIGQLIVPMTEQVDYVCPMVYPSHYYKGEYGIPHPNAEPYRTIYYGMRDAIRTLGPQSAKLRPWLQDFSLFGVKYGPKEIRAQMQACADLGIQDWSMWNAGGTYTWSALETPAEPAQKNP